jgi:SRSO17 transposase
MYCVAWGKTGNCQVGVSVHAVTDWASVAIDWRLFLSEAAEQGVSPVRQRYRCGNRGNAH